MTNMNLTYGIAYGYISANALHSDIVCSLQEGKDVYYEEALEEHLAGLRDDPDFDEDEATEKFSDTWMGDEPVHEGTIKVAGGNFPEVTELKYRTSWLGGALNVWIFESPFVTDKARKASPCVPGAGILDTLDGDVRSFDVPPTWRCEKGG